MHIQKIHEMLRPYQKFTIENAAVLTHQIQLQTPIQETDPLPSARSAST